MQDNIRWQLIESEPDQNILDQWQLLSDKNPDSCASSFPAFTLNSQVFLKEVKFLYVIAYCDDTMICVIPLFIRKKVVSRLNVRILQIINHNHLDTYVIAGQNLFDLNELIPDFLHFIRHHLPGWDYFHAHNIISDNPVSSEYQIPYYVNKSAFFNVRSNQSFNEVMSKKMLKNISRLQKKLISSVGSIHLRCVNSTDEIKTELKTFMDIENSGWKSKANSSIICDNDVYNFYKFTWEDFSKADKAQIYILYADDTAVAAALSFKHGSCIYLHKIAYLGSTSSYGTGSILVKLVLESAFLLDSIDTVCLNTCPDWVKRWHPEINLLNSIEHFNVSLNGIALRMMFGIYRLVQKFYRSSIKG